MRPDLYLRPLARVIPNLPRRPPAIRDAEMRRWASAQSHFRTFSIPAAPQCARVDRYRQAARSRHHRAGPDHARTTGHGDRARRRRLAAREPRVGGQDDRPSSPHRPRGGTRSRTRPGHRRDEGIRARPGSRGLRMPLLDHINKVTLSPSCKEGVGGWSGHTAAPRSRTDGCLSLRSARVSRPRRSARPEASSILRRPKSHRGLTVAEHAPAEGDLSVQALRRGRETLRRTKTGAFGVVRTPGMPRSRTAGSLSLRLEPQNHQKCQKNHSTKAMVNLAFLVST